MKKTKEKKNSKRASVQKMFHQHKKKSTSQEKTISKKRKDPFEAAIAYLESLDEGCEKPTMAYSYDTCQTEGCTHPGHQNPPIMKHTVSQNSSECVDSSNANSSSFQKLESKKEIQKNKKKNSKKINNKRENSIKKKRPNST